MLKTSHVCYNYLTIYIVGEGDEMTMNNDERKKFMTYLHKETKNTHDEIFFSLFDNISMGDMQAIIDHINKTDSGLSESKAELREKYPNIESLKIVLDSINLACTNAARFGKLPKQFAYLIHKSFNILIQEATSVDFLIETVIKKMLVDYTSAVNQFSTRSYSHTITSVVNDILDNLNEELVLQSVGDRYSIHPVHLARKFKQETGITFVQYITTQRLYLAKFLIVNKRLPLSEVSELCGFNSQSYFSKVFKKEIGQTPTQYAHTVYEKLAE